MIENIELEELKRFLDNLPNEAEREFDLKLTNYASIVQNNTVDNLKKILENGQNNKNSYAAFYCLNIIYRRNKDYSILNDIINNYKPIFKDHPTFNHLIVLYNIEKGINKDFEEIINMSYDDSINMPDNAGFIHLFADTVASICEEVDKESSNKTKEKWLLKATEAVDKAIVLDRKYAKYYCTKARLLSLSEKYDEALDFIRYAIDFEDSSKKDYSIRIGSYQYYRLLIQSNKQNKLVETTFGEYMNKLSIRQDEINKEISNSISKVDEAMIKNLEFLGFFAGIVSFTIGSIQITGGQSFSSAARLILVLMGSLLCAFSGFGFILHGIKKGKILQNVIVTILGILIILGGVFIVR